MNKLLIFLLVFITFACGKTNKDLYNSNKDKGKLFIIGGGKRSPELLKVLIDESKIKSEGYIVVLPMSSDEPDSAFYYAKKQFVDMGISSNKILNYNTNDSLFFRSSMLDSIKTAPLIYITGGDQKRFMQIVINKPIHDAIRIAYKNGSIVAGTSAGAAVMSKMMISGNQIKYPKYTGDFQTIESNNIELTDGLGLIDNVIIDQHFIKRMRMNRLISVVLENPSITGIGIDEATAIFVNGDSATVIGESQVIVLRNTDAQTSLYKDLIGGENLHLSVFLPGSKFLIK
jgi:cyanophycinase